MNLQLKDVQDRRICVITGKFLPTYAHVRVDESGHIGLLFDSRAAQAGRLDEPGCDVVSSNENLPLFASLHWHRPELLRRIYEVKPGDLEFGLGCPLAVKEEDLAEFRQFVCNCPPTASQPDVSS